MDLCEMLGADAYVNGNVGSGTVREMSEWVEYLTRDGDSPMARLRRENGRDEPWKVPFWGIGNEAWGCGGNMSPEQYTAEARRYATFCRNHGGNELYRIAAGGPDDDIRWTRALMESLGCLTCGSNPTPVFQAVTFHYYTHAGPGIHSEPALEFTDEQFYATMRGALDVERIIRRHEAVMDSYDPDRTVGLILDEWGTWWTVEEGTNPGFLFQQNTVRDALVASVHFDAFHRHAGRLKMANIAQTLNVLQAMILTDDDGSMVLTPTYHVFEMNRGHHDAAALATHVLEAPTVADGVPGLSASASTRDGSALVSLSNLSATEALEVRVDLRGRAATVRRARVLAGADASSHNTPEAPDAVAPVALDTRIEDGMLLATLPAASFATVELDLG
jgi:alpha-N-arabinofuranosidase